VGRAGKTKETAEDAPKVSEHSHERRYPLSRGCQDISSNYLVERNSVARFFNSGVLLFKIISPPDPRLFKYHNGNFDVFRKLAEIFVAPGPRTPDENGEKF
jgi:hypothetical protein